ncbi:Hypp1428 [Branchiostoma lanceolatum]|uniref:Hypp1428 protein n=1 Tax=Branchiostoma lanceolatum TaxID=7740 RepID=A0A8J9ZK35_BRALA|nr:Hypp1428 [Branchiostoma lanceolatum]
MSRKRRARGKAQARRRPKTAVAASFPPNQEGLSDRSSRLYLWAAMATVVLVATAGAIVIASGSTTTAEQATPRTPSAGVRWQDSIGDRHDPEEFEFSQYSQWESDRAATKPLLMMTLLQWRWMTTGRYHTTRTGDTRSYDAAGGLEIHGTEPVDNAQIPGLVPKNKVDGKDCDTKRQTSPNPPLMALFGVRHEEKHAPGALESTLHVDEGYLTDAPINDGYDDYRPQNSSVPYDQTSAPGGLGSDRTDSPTMDEVPSNQLNTDKGLDGQGAESVDGFPSQTTESNGGEHIVKNKIENTRVKKQGLSNLLRKADRTVFVIVGTFVAVSVTHQYLTHGL